jgi:hypothetical protein
MCDRLDPSHQATPPIIWRLGISPHLTKRQIKNRKMNTTEKTFQAVGNLSDFVGANEQIYTDTINLRDANKQIYVKFNHDGVKKTAICSWAITNMLRNKQIALGNLFDYPLSLSNDGLYSIHMEERVLTGHKRSALTIKKLVEVAVTDEETIVL